MPKFVHPTALANFLTERLRLYGFRTRLANAALYHKAEKCQTPADYINLTFNVFRRPPWNWVGWTIRPMQIPEEFGKLLEIVRERKVSRMLEVGTASGGTLFLFTRVLNVDAKIVSLDLPRGRFGGGYEDFKMGFFTNFAKENQHIYLVRADSHTQASFAAVKALLEDQLTDFVFIDGDHTYEGVKADFQMYSQLVRKGGLIAFHDICKGPPEFVGEVHRFWNEIKDSYQTEEIIANPKQKGFGIGLLHV